MNLRDEPFFQGQLLFPPQGMLGQLKKTWQPKFCQIFRASKYGIERLEIYDAREEVASQQHSPRILTLEACVKIAPGNQPRVFAVFTKSGVHHFGCYSDADTADWIEAFRTVAFKGDRSDGNVEEDNDLYCTSGEGVFSVKVVETEASERCKLEAKSYTLVVAAADMKLVDGETLVYTWPYRYIRRYGYRDGKFTFEAGRKCESGEGSFRLEHSNQQEIFRCISSKMKSMKKLLNGESSPGIECNDAQYHAALSMEAGSRSPLPPSPNSCASGNTSNNLIDLDFSTISQNSQKQHPPPSFSSLDAVPFARQPPPIVKPKPAKPPRKSIFTGLLEKKSAETEIGRETSGVYRKLNQSCGGGGTTTATTAATAATTTTTTTTTISSIGNGNNNGSSESLSHRSVACSLRSSNDRQHPYDLVEVRSGAWKTHGLDNIPHTERNDRASYSSDERENEAATAAAAPAATTAASTTTAAAAAAAATPTIELDNDANVEAITRSGERNESSRYETINTHLVPTAIRKQSLESSLMCSVAGASIVAAGLASTAIAAAAASPIIHNDVLVKSDYPNYDKLQHFGSMHKLNNSSGYKTPNIGSQANSAVFADETSDPWPNYDVVENLCAIRLADDTRNGYGVIRKKTNTSNNTSGTPKRSVFNESEYAIVSKPKRV